MEDGGKEEWKMEERKRGMEQKTKETKENGGGKLRRRAWKMEKWKKGGMEDGGREEGGMEDGKRGMKERGRVLFG
jgi:hypothetical protein